MAIATLLIIGGLAVSAWAVLSDGPEAVPPAPVIEAPAKLTPPAPRASKSDGVQAEIISIRPGGFEPARITRPKGRFILVVNNRSWLEEIDLRLERGDGSPVSKARRARNKPDWREVVDLSPGRYVLKEANNPGWACRITITPQ
jgi:hypothetical protein